MNVDHSTGVSGVNIKGDDFWKLRSLGQEILQSYMVSMKILEECLITLACIDVSSSYLEESTIGRWIGKRDQFIFIARV